MFDFNDLNRDDDFYANFEVEPDDDGEFLSCLMLTTSLLKELNYDDYIKSGHQLMMKIFNMTGLKPNQDSEQALNVLMCLLSHLYAMLAHNENRENYFKYFDSTVIYPMMQGGLNGLDD